jgi:DNA-binding beta-propeller fold protein YncE
LNPDGTTSMTFPPTGASSGVDADAAGNVYITLNGIRKYSPDGQLLNTTPISGVTGDLAVDEIGQTLYLGRGTNIGQGPVGEILAYDISTPTPTFLHSIPGPPGMFGISFDPVSGNLFAANLFGGSAWEIATDGTIVQKYSLPGMYVHDVVAIRVPEIFSLGMLVAAIACGPLRRMRRVRSA